MRKFLFIGFIAYSAIEVAILVELGRIFGLGWVMAWVALTVLGGVACLRVQGISALRRVSRQLHMENLPTRELADLLLVLTAALLLISPGILADFAGLLLLVPFVRAGIRRLILNLLPRWVPEEFPQANLRTAAKNVIEIEREPQL